ncbi:PREDICTED: uncharacterized protein LOC106099408 isoform X2 [Papilio polytes]|uniref:uncharacterized protein LOC106099408 isoform X2 n=1 Tax=Papilio polytes TaxID=76194 RepID=UPI0006766473|nr:PREDICTED: uncharacterized protein LOC106099408 isoform X2 [Papilio polytes]
MSGYRNNNRRKRLRSRWQRTTTLLSNMINTISTSLLDRINGFRSFNAKHPPNHNSLFESDQSSETDDCRSPPQKRRCNNRISQPALHSPHSNNGTRVVEIIDTDSESDGPTEIPRRQGYWQQIDKRIMFLCIFELVVMHLDLHVDCTNRATNINEKPSSSGAYPSISSTSSLQDSRRVRSLLRPARLIFDDTNNMYQSSKNLGNTQQAQNDTYVRNTPLENITLRGVVKAQDPGPSRNHKTRAVVTRQTPYCIPRYRSSFSSGTTPSAIRSRRRAVENASPIEIGSSSSDLIIVEMDREVSNQAVPRDTMFMQPEIIDNCPEKHPRQVSSNITLGNPSSTQNESDQFNELIMANHDKWECATCIGLNERTTTICFCCGSLALNANIDCGVSATAVHGEPTQCPGSNGPVNIYAGFGCCNRRSPLFTH